MAAELDDLLVDFEGPNRWKKLAYLLAGMVALLVAGFGAYDSLISKETVKTAPSQTVEVKRGAITTNVSLTGVTEAQSTSQLNFEQTGVVTKVNVTLGQEVKQGDVLAEQESVAATDAVKQAELSVQAAQIRLNELTKPPTAADSASADQSVLTAQSALTKAIDELRKLKEGPTAAESSAAQQAVTQAQSAVAQALSAREKLTGPNSASDRTAADAAVQQAQGAVRTADSGLSTAQNAIVTAQAGLYSAETAFCPDGGVTFCASRVAPISAGDESALLNATGSGTAERATKASAVLQANAAYKNAVSARTSAQSTLDSARRDLGTAQAKLTSTPNGPSASDLVAADGAVVSARQGLDTARQKLADLTRPDDAALRSAQSAIDSAQAGLVSAQAKRDEVQRGAKPSDVELQRNSVQVAQLALKKAQDDLTKTKLVAPFDGTIAALAVVVGDRALGAGTGGDGSSSAAITMNTPKALHLDLTVGESDLSKVKPGQRGIASFSGLDSAAFPVEIESIGSLPTASQGVVTYKARAKLLLPDSSAVVPDAAAGQPSVITLAPGQTSPTGANPQASQPGAGVIVPNQAAPGGAGSITSGPVLQFGGPSAAQTSKPAPGMQAQVTVITDQRTGVLTVPQRAVSREGLDSVVKVQKDDGSVETVKVKTGLSNGQQVEITEGLTEGQKVQLPAITPATGSGGSKGGPAGDSQFFISPGGAIGAPSGGAPVIIQQTR